MLLIQFLRNKKTYQEYKNWLQRYKEIYNFKRTLPIFCSVIISTSTKNEKYKLLLLKIGSWIYIVDDLFDDRLKDWEDISGNLYNLDSKNLYFKLLNDIRSDISNFFGDENLHKWDNYSKKMLVEMKNENYKQNYLSLEDYLNKSKHSVGLFIFTMILSLIEGVDIANFENKEDLNDLFNKSAIYIRLVNDLRSYQREIIEGKSNYILIMNKDVDDIMRSKKQIESQTEIILKEIKDLKRTDRNFNNLEYGLYKFCKFINNLYKIDDFHNATSKKFAFFRLLITN